MGLTRQTGISDWRAPSSSPVMVSEPKGLTPQVKLKTAPREWSHDAANIERIGTRLRASSPRGPQAGRPRVRRLGPWSRQQAPARRLLQRPEVRRLRRVSRRVRRPRPRPSRRLRLRVRRRRRPAPRLLRLQLLSVKLQMLKRVALPRGEPPLRLPVPVLRPVLPGPALPSSGELADHRQAPSWRRCRRELHWSRLSARAPVSGQWPVEQAASPKRASRVPDRVI